MVYPPLFQLRVVPPVVFDGWPQLEGVRWRWCSSGKFETRLASSAFFTLDHRVEPLVVRELHLDLRNGSEHFGVFRVELLYTGGDVLPEGLGLEEDVVLRAREGRPGVEEFFEGGCVGASGQLRRRF